MKDKIALTLIWFAAAVSASPVPASKLPSKINITAEMELMNGRVIRPSVEIPEDQWGVIDLDGVGVKVRAHRQGKRFVKMEYQLFLQNGPNHKDWKVAHVVAPWSQRMAAHIPADNNSRIRRLALTSTLLEQQPIK